MTAPIEVTLRLRAWPVFEWREAFWWGRCATRLVLALGPATACFALGQGLLGLGLVAFGIWPWPISIAITEGAIEWRWLFLRRVVPLAEIATLRRRGGGSVWPHHDRLVLARTDGRELLLRAPSATLDELESALRRLGIETA